MCKDLQGFIAVLLKDRPRVEKIKKAFKSKAEEANAGIRWGKAKRFWQSQTSLAGVVKKLNVLAADCDESNMRAVFDEIDNLPTAKATKYKDALDELKKELNKTVVSSEEITDGIVSQKLGSGKYQITGSTGETVGTDLEKTKVEYVGDVLGGLSKIAKTTGLQFDNLDKLVKSICDDPKLGGESGKLKGTIWDEAMKHLTDSVLPTIAQDLNQLNKGGLLAKGSNLKGVEFTGSDFHKGGKQVLILRFEDSKGQEKKVVYKPSSLMVDSLLYGDGGVASKLGGVSTYNIQPMKSTDKPPKDLGYGYMEYIDTGGSPSSAKDVLGVYVGVAANMAMSYYVGLDDVHYDNIIMKKGDVQIIDMEATTGVFNEKGLPHTGGFYDQLWQKAIYEGIKTALMKLINKGTLTELPDDEAVKKAMLKKFKQVVVAMGDEDNAPDLKKLEKELSKQTTRTVPIATNDFQKELIPKAQKCKTFKDWQTLLEDESVLQIGKGQTTTPLSTIKNLLNTKGVYNALKRGDVPYYTRELGSDVVCDEKGEQIQVPGYKKVGQSIKVEMESRRTKDPKGAIDAFEKQGIKQVMDTQSFLRDVLKSKK